MQKLESKALACFVKLVKCLLKEKSARSVQSGSVQTICVLLACHVRSTRFTIHSCTIAEVVDQANKLDPRDTTASNAQKESIVTMNTSAKTAWLVRARPTQPRRARCAHRISRLQQETTALSARVAILTLLITRNVCCSMPSLLGEFLGWS